MRTNKPYKDENGEWKSERNLALQHRMPWVEYSQPGTYMITLCTNGRKPLFGQLVATDNDPSNANIHASAVGRIVEQEWNNISTHEPAIIVQGIQLMPDHIHGILYVKQKMEHPLGQVIRGFKMRCTSIYRALIHDDMKKPTPQDGKTSLTISQRREIAKHSLWEPNYNDRIAYTKERLETLLAYMHDNPRRLALKRRNPAYFALMRNVTIATPYGELTFSAMGSMHLLDKQDKQVVQCSRSLTHGEENDEYRALMHDALERAKAETVTISAAISKGEQMICKTIREKGLPLIILMKDGFPSQDDPKSKYYKPGGVLFEGCAKGQLLLMEPIPETFELNAIKAVVYQKSPDIPSTSMRYRFLALNEIARLIATTSFIVH